MIVWLNGAHGVGKSTTSVFVQQAIPDSRIFDPEKIGEVLMDVKPGLPATDDFQHWPPWRPLVVETARHLIEYTGGTLIVPMTVLVEDYWREISSGLAGYGITVRHFVLHAEESALLERIDHDATLAPSAFRRKHVEPSAAAVRSWLPDAGEIIDTTRLTPPQAAEQIVRSLP